MAQASYGRLTLVSHNLCPYVQRAAIALAELGMEFERLYVDLGAPPDWFREISPLGRVPLLLVDGETVLFESAVIAEYVNELGGGGLLAADALARAQQRAWIEFASAVLADIAALYNAGDEPGYLAVVERLDGRWQRLEARLRQADYFDGADFSLVDAAFAPVFRYFDLFEQLAEENFLGEYPRISAWRVRLSARESVRLAVLPDYPRLLLDFIAARDSWLGTMARGRLDEVAA